MVPKHLEFTNKERHFIEQSAIGIDGVEMSSLELEPIKVQPPQIKVAKDQSLLQEEKDKVKDDIIKTLKKPRAAKARTWNAGFSAKLWTL